MFIFLEEVDLTEHRNLSAISGTMTSGMKIIFFRLSLKSFDAAIIIGTVIKNEKNRTVMYAPG